MKDDHPTILNYCTQLAAALILLAGCEGKPDSCNGCGAGPGGEGGAPQVEQNQTLGVQCERTSDCQAPLACLHEAEDGVLPSGICSLNCQDQADACDSSGGVCHLVGGSDLCLLPCEFGEGAGTCSRGNSYCAPADSNAGGVCRPGCTSFDQCPSDLECDLAVGLCVEDASTPEGYFDACGQVEEECAATCVEFDEVASVCSSPCDFAGGAICGPQDVPGLCAYSAAGAGIGDLGYCAQLCDCDDECGSSALSCDAFSDEAVAEQLGFRGLCAPLDSGVGGASSGIACVD